MFILRMEWYCIWPHFSRKLTHVLICKLSLWVYQIPSVYTANIYPIERQGYVFMLFHFLRHQDLQGRKHNWDDFPHWSSSAWPLFLNFSEFTSITVFLACVQKYLYFGKLSIWWQVEQHQRKRSEICVHKQMMLFSRNGFIHCNSWCWEPDVHTVVISESILQADFSAVLWAERLTTVRVH